MTDDLGTPPETESEPVTPNTAFILLAPDGKVGIGAGPGVPLRFLQDYFSEAEAIIRIASAYFTLSGYKIGRRYARPEIQFRVLVGKEEGKNVQTTVLHEILEELRQPEIELYATVEELVRRLMTGEFKIMDARAVQTAYHCKFYISDEKALWHGSSNFSNRGLRQSSEQCQASRSPAEILGFIRWYEEQALRAKDLVADLLRELLKFLELAAPFDVYLKTLILLNDLPDQPLREGVHHPAYYQKAVVARALRQLRDWGGACLVVATGLGKTVIGAEIAGRMHQSGAIKRVVLLTPPGKVQQSWEVEILGRDIPLQPFSLDSLFRQAKERHYKAARLEEALQTADAQTLILIDEAHTYKNEIAKQSIPGEISRVYERIHAATQRGAKVVLLTATAYGTSHENLDGLLYLLPHRASQTDLFQQWEDQPWKAADSDAFTRLPPVTVLGLPHVLNMARKRNDVDDAGRVFILRGEERVYLPKTIARARVRYTLPLLAEVLAVLDAGCFDQKKRIRQTYYNDDKRQHEQAPVDAVYHHSALINWLSSPQAFRASLERNLITEDVDERIGLFNPEDWDKPARKKKPSRSSKRKKDKKKNGTVPYGTPLAVSHAERERLLVPIKEAFAKIAPEADDKLQKFLGIITARCQNRAKAIVFVRRYQTAVYLQETLKHSHSQLNVGCTIAGSSEDEATHLLELRERAFLINRFAPRANRYLFRKGEKELDVLICSDADGVGVNLQDADTVINYDPPQSAVELFQRVGRVLRPTTEPERTIFFYTLEASLETEASSTSETVASVQAVYDRIRRRHQRMSSIIGTSVLADEDYSAVSTETEVDVDELMQDTDFAKAVSAIATTNLHNDVLEQYRKRAEALPDILTSAREYAEADNRMYVLVQKGKDYIPILYNLSRQRLEPSPSDTDLLEMIACEESEPIANFVPFDRIERCANQTVRAWCKAQGEASEHIHKVCSMYLKSKQDNYALEDFVAEILTEDNKP